LALCLSAHLSFTIPISETGIPFTAQSFAVFVVAGLLAPQAFSIVIVLYFILGGLGLPVFADGSSGFEKFVGNSGGFLYGFLFSGLFISFCMDKMKDNMGFIVLLIMLVATVILFIFGLSHLALKLDFSKSITYGLLPFWKMALFKAILATLFVFCVKRYVLQKSTY